MPNWKFKQWSKRQVSEFNDLETYISLNLCAEDIEIFSKVLLPEVMEYKEAVLYAGINATGQDRQAVKNLFDRHHAGLSLTETEKVINELNIADIFFNTVDLTSAETIGQIARLLQHNWEYFLLKRFPQKRFIVEIYGEAHEPYIRFYQAPSISCQSKE